MIEPLRLWVGDVPSIDFSERRQRLSLNPIVRAHGDTRAELDLGVRYGPLLTQYRLVDKSEAEYALLPRFVELVAPAGFRHFLRRAETAGLPTLVFSGGDVEPIMPDQSIVLLHPGPTRGAQPHAHSVAVPYMLTDRGGPAVERVDRSRPSVAFCGQGAQGLLARSGHTLLRLRHQVLHQVKPVDVPPPVRGHVRLRADALRCLSQDERVDDRFVVRKKYRAGAATDDERSRTQDEFDDNLRSATYALCVRGTGNFSARFYEALSLGRIPLFVNTDCVLPFEDEIDWQRHTVWVEAADRASIADILVSAHRRAANDPDRTALALRKLWEERLTEHGFFSHLPAALRRLSIGQGSISD